MRISKWLLISILFIAFGCKDGYIDDITAVEPGADESAPVVDIMYPAEGTQLQVNEAVTSINIEFKVTDDIEIGNVVLMMDGEQIASFSEFKDYRKFLEEYLYDNVTNGTHTLSIKATDLDGKSTTESVNFEKLPPYTPIFDGEMFYMPFDGDYTELVSITNATEVGNPGFAGESYQGGNAYAGATDSYLTFPSDGLEGDEFSAAFWMKINAVPDRAGILVVGPPDPANPGAENVRTSGFRFFRENAGGMQRFKLNVGTGASEAWFDGGTNADVDPTTNEWVHFAFTISQTEAAVYINGQVVSQGTFDGIDWTDCDLLSIMSGAPHFTGWDHKSDLSYMDELRLFDKALTPEEILNVMAAAPVNYEPVYDGEVFYMPFNGNDKELVSGEEASVVGSPGFDTGISGQAYAGAADSYLTFPTDALKNDEFSAVFWLNINATPDRAGILVMGPEDTENANYPDVQNLRTSGFRFFREDAGGMQRFKLNVGDGTADTWVDGGTDADVDPTTGDWVHFAFTISSTAATVYINGVEVKQSTFDGIDWTGCDVISIMSGAPRFTEWSHFSDQSLMDELRIFNKALTQEEIQAIIDAES